MSQSTVAKRYALALFQLAKEHGQLDSIESELKIVKDIFTSSKDLRTVLESPKLSLEKKKELIKQAFSSASVYVLNTLMILVDCHRANIIGEMAEEFIKLSYEDKGLAEAKVYSVRLLTEDERTALAETFSKKLGKKQIVIDNEIDTNLLGGLKIRVGNRIFDGSLRGKLERLERELIG